MTWEVVSKDYDDLTQETAYYIKAESVPRGSVKIKVLQDGTIEIDTFNCVGIRVSDLTEFIGMLVAVTSMEEAK
jgi:hypothetical protein